MDESRVALKLIFSSIRFLLTQGIAIRGKTEETSNLRQLLLERAMDVLALEKWLNRPEKYKWISPEISNEIIMDFSLALQRIISKELKQTTFFAVMMDETSDISNKEQVQNQW